MLKVKLSHTLLHPFHLFGYRDIQLSRQGFYHPYPIKRNQHPMCQFPSHTTVELQQAGYNVVIVDNLSNSKPEVVDGIEKITGIRPALSKLTVVT